MTHIIGIDLGTRFSCVSLWRNKRSEIICDQFGNRTIPSIVSFFRSARLVGHNALAMKEVHPTNTIYDIKRLIGRRFNDPIVEQTRNLIAYEITHDDTEHQNILVQLDNTDTELSQKRVYRPEEICAYILIEIKKMALTYLTDAQLQAVITVPAYFNDAQRQSTLDAAKIAGIDVLKIINESTAASLAYGLGDKVNGNVIMYDFGAGTLDVSLMNIDNGVFKTLAVSGNMYLGGEDIDYLIMNHVIIDFQKQHKITKFRLSKLSQIKLKNAAETAKKVLSSTDKAVICVDDFHNATKLYYVLTREVLESICNELFIMAMKPIRDVLDSAGLSRDDINHVILVGGSTRIPKIKTLIQCFFNNDKLLCCSLNPDEVVAIGASIYGYVMVHKEDPFSENLVLLDITPLSLGVETLQKRMTVIIPRNTVIPTHKTKIFSTDTDDQDSVAIRIFEGERQLTRHNFHVGTFELTGFEKGPRGFPVIKITFHIDINGILQVTAVEKKSDVQNNITITSTWGAKGRLSRTEIDALITEAASNEQIDMLYALKIGLTHTINSICHNVLVNLKNTSCNLTNVDRDKIKRDVKANLKWLKTNDINRMDVEELKSRESRLTRLYAPLIVQINRQNDKFMENTPSTNLVEIYGDDDNNDSTQYQRVDFNDTLDYEKEEIKELKRVISDLGKNILSIINNPICKLSNEDVTTITDYIGSVQIWLYTTSATTTIEYVAKINEINKMTEEIMAKYDDRVFTKNDQFTIRDELHLTCLTLNMSLKSNYFSLKASATDDLKQLITDTMLWLVGHQNEEFTEYDTRLRAINELCNSIYHATDEPKPSETPEDDSDEDVPAPTINKIDERIDSLLATLPDRVNRRITINADNTNDVLIKLDINKLNSGYQTNVG